MTLIEREDAEFMDRLSDLIRKGTEDHGCPVCQEPVPGPVMDEGGTAHPSCRARNAGRLTVIESKETRAKRGQS